MTDSKKTQPDVAMEKVDGVFRTRSLGVAASGLPDQYADGKAAQVWSVYIGEVLQRTALYKQFLVRILHSHDAKRVLDVACGTGIDSLLLLEEGFEMTSSDASDKMLRYALKERWNRRKEPAFNKWVIEEANWLSLEEDLEDTIDMSKGFDAVICLGNSFAHLPDFDGTQMAQTQALANFWKFVKPGGILMIDHRNYDDILLTGKAPNTGVYYNSDHVVQLKCSTLYVEGQPSLVTLDYALDISHLPKTPADIEIEGKKVRTFRLSYYPHKLAEFSKLLEKLFGNTMRHTVYGDFKQLDEIDNPGYYIHIVEKLA